MKIKFGLIGFGRMGQLYLRELTKSELWEVTYICDTNERVRELARKLSPNSIVTDNQEDIFCDKEILAVGLFALADSRKHQVERAIQTGKHILAEKPISDTLEHEWETVRLIEKTNLISGINLYLRNAWYHQTIKDFIDKGEIGDLAILRICHMTPGLSPGEGHEYEGPAFHDCGMHYVDIARWYAGCDYKTWHAQGVRMWNYKDPWWVQCHGTFLNGVVFDITQGFVYGQLAKDQTHNCYIDVIGTKGIARMTHDFENAVVELRGVSETLCIEQPFGGKNIDILCKLFAESILSGHRNDKLPSIKDSVIASEYAWTFLQNARQNDLPAIGSLETLKEIHERRRNMTNGYGLIKNNTI